MKDSELDELILKSARLAKKLSIAKALKGLY